jgi:ankyrin repeat protein
MSTLKHIDVVKFLLKKGACSSIRNEFGSTPSEAATVRGFDDIAKLLLNA